MPQFDPSSFASQIFWLAICFSLIYLALSKIFLPRIRDILQNRQNVITNENTLAQQLQTEIDEIEANSKLLRDTSAMQYNIAVEQSMKQAALSRDAAINEAKAKIAKMIDDSHKEMREIKNNSVNDCQKAIEDLVKKIDNKFLNT